MKREAMYYEKLRADNNSDIVICTLCPHRCKIKSGKCGICTIRSNRRGILFSENYGKVTSIALDNIEKKPLRNFFPGSKILSIGSYGCNFRCNFCQNHSISMSKPAFKEMKAEEIAEVSVRMAPHGNIGVAYTYNEPLIGYEFVLDCAKLIREQGQKNIVVTNGFINEEPLNELLPYIDAMNIDLKSFSNDFYRAIGGSIEPVKNSIRIAVEHCHVEITCLIIEGKNDSEDEMKAMAAWLSEINDKIPLHVSRYFPAYKMNTGFPTKISTIHRLAEIAGNYLKNVYVGNVL
ncbi:MAG: AmmeMemoRadiSam system radical SAM enzyme [Anaerovoracaceae bacterium]|jgi:pyruvate formate lyase activating enzyme